MEGKSVGWRIFLTLLPACLVAEEIPYQAPDLGRPVLNMAHERISVPEIRSIVRLLITVVHAPGDEVDGLTRGKALALAHSMRPEERIAVLTDFQLRHGRPLEETPTVLKPVWAMVEERDANGDGKISEEEAPNLVKAWQSFDRDQDSALNADELREARRTPSGRRAFPSVESLIGELERVESELMVGVSSPSEASQRLAHFLSDIQAGLGKDPQSLMSYGEEADWGDVFSGGNDGGVQKMASLAFAAKAGGKGERFSRRQSLIKGLLVIQLEGSQFAGGASQMNATAVPAQPGQPTAVSFNQPVGKSMNNGLKKVLEFVVARHGGLPAGNRVEISFERQYSPKDGDSASVACALLLDSLVSGDDLEPGFAVTGAMAPDGEVKAVGGIDGKIRGAAARDCSHVAIPKANEGDLLDLMLVDGPAALAKIPVFTISTFEEAYELARPKGARKADLEQSLELFASVQKALSRPGSEGYLRNPQMQQRLRQVVQLTPNHGSARGLLLLALGRAPKTISLRGSLAVIDRTALPLIQGLQNTSFGLNGKGMSLENDKFAETAYGIRRIRSTLHPEARGAADAIMKYSELIRELKNRPPGNPANYNKLVDQIRKAGASVVAEYDEVIAKVKEDAN